MARLSDFLERFRPTGVPGGAAPTGVPADYTADPAAELTPVFSAIADTQAECDRERERARHRAEEIRERGRAQAAAMVLAARLEAEAEKARASAAARRRGDRENAAIMREAVLAADRVRIRAAARMPEEVARVVTMVRSLAGDSP
ncbi:hypothetical protein [Streptosporangium sp. NPDC051022]|uniref:hypothetical protein n=1 Tax=Streptosporangium sp. NPDC051022 TaxID=3155752 RepID=UPI00343A5D29